jgi:hypothetical protein
MIGYTNCKVSDVQSVIVHSGDDGSGHGFSILGGAHGRPLVGFAFATEAERKAGAGGGRQGG